MKIHYKGMTINQQYIDPTYSDQWVFGTKSGRMGYGVVGLCLADLLTVADARTMIDKFVSGKIRL